MKYILAILVISAISLAGFNFGANNFTGNVLTTVGISAGGTGQTTQQAAIDALLPSQTSNSGKFLSTNGTTSSWANIVPLFTQTSSATVANTVTETTLIGSGSGSVTLPANFFTVGRSVRFKAWGFHSSTGNPNITVRIKLGSTTILTTGSVSTSNGTNGLAEADGVITCRTTGVSGTVFGQGIYRDFNNAADIYPMVNTTTSTIDTTGTLDFNLTFEWGSANANNTVTLTNLVLEAL